MFRDEVLLPTASTPRPLRRSAGIFTHNRFPDTSAAHSLDAILLLTFDNNINTLMSKVDNKLPGEGIPGCKTQEELTCCKGHSTC
jgi:hypothetical protein